MELQSTALPCRVSLALVGPWTTRKAERTARGGPGVINLHCTPDRNLDLLPAGLS